MTVGLLLITHNRIGTELLDTAARMLGQPPRAAIAVDVRESDDRDQLSARVRQRLEALDEGDGILVLTDLFGATPCNIATDLRERRDVRILSGLNLPMLVRALNYRELGLAEMVERALDGGHAGMFDCTTERP